ncbi:hypothetical protein, partial [Deinococcus aquaticus]|uniref:hypothetical protein n=1 Tax=Deinococcus aquaticus TaxID=328692 RepID=UPI003F47D91C
MFEEVVEGIDDHSLLVAVSCVEQADSKSFFSEVQTADGFAAVIVEKDRAVGLVFADVDPGVVDFVPEDGFDDVEGLPFFWGDV